MGETRNRAPKSCEPCRTRKLKCNRASPCDSCIRRGKISICRYASIVANANRIGASHASASDRLRNLENLVASLISNTDASETPSSVQSSGRTGEISRTSTPKDGFSVGGDGGSSSLSSLVDVADAPSGLLVRGGQTIYVDASHWSSILANLREIREQLAGSDDTQDPQQQQGRVSPSLESSSAYNEWTSEENEIEDHTDIVFGPMAALSMPEILASLPPRQVCDYLVSKYFHSPFILLPVLHPVKFQREYESFWEIPEQTSHLWVSLLFAILSLAAAMEALSSPGASSGAGSSSLSEHGVPSAKALSKRTEQCLVLGKYVTAEEHGLEALLIHLQGAFLRNKDADVNGWLLAGIIIRLAIRRGYHRDPAKLAGSKLSAFDGEMRRRIWVSIVQADALMSFQIGVPSMIPSDSCDTELPRNLAFSDFAPETLVLPPSRPRSDYTPILYTIVKAPVVDVFKKVVSHTRSLAPTSYQQTMALDRDARDAYGNLPEGFKYKPVRQSFLVDGADVIMRRATIELLHLKTLIILHQRYITHPSRYKSTPRSDLNNRDPGNRPDHSEGEFGWSYRACLTAAREILKRQAELYHLMPDGQLPYERWIVSALTNSDFILAAMVVCLELTVQMRHGEMESDFAKHLAALQLCQHIWSTASSYSTEARITATALSRTIQRLQSPTATMPYRSQEPGQAQDLPIEPITSQPTLPNLDPMLGVSSWGEHIDWVSLTENCLPCAAPIRFDERALVESYKRYKLTRLGYRPRSPSSINSMKPRLVKNMIWICRR